MLRCNKAFLAQECLNYSFYLQLFHNLLHYGGSDVLNVLVQITDVATLRAAREEDLKECGLKMGEIIRLRRALQQDGCNSEEQIESDLSDISVLQSSASELSPDDMDVDKRKQVYW